MTSPLLPHIDSRSSYPPVGDKPKFLTKVRKLKHYQPINSVTSVLVPRPPDSRPPLPQIGNRWRWRQIEKPPDPPFTDMQVVLSSPDLSQLQPTPPVVQPPMLPTGESRRYLLSVERRKPRPPQHDDFMIKRGILGLVNNYASSSNAALARRATSSPRFMLNPLCSRIVLAEVHNLVLGELRKLSKIEPDHLREVEHRFKVIDKKMESGERQALPLHFNILIRRIKSILNHNSDLISFRTDGVVKQLHDAADASDIVKLEVIKQKEECLFDRIDTLSICTTACKDSNPDFVKVLLQMAPDVTFTALVALLQSKRKEEEKRMLFHELFPFIYLEGVENFIMKEIVVCKLSIRDFIFPLISDGMAVPCTDIYHESEELTRAKVYLGSRDGQNAHDANPRFARVRASQLRAFNQAKATREKAYKKFVTQDLKTISCLIKPLREIILSFVVCEVTVAPDRIMLYDQCVKEDRKAASPPAS